MVLNSVIPTKGQHIDTQSLEKTGILNFRLIWIANATTCLRAEALGQLSNDFIPRCVISEQLWLESHVSGYQSARSRIALTIYQPAAEWRLLCCCRINSVFLFCLAVEVFQYFCSVAPSCSISVSLLFNYYWDILTGSIAIFCFCLETLLKYWTHWPLNYTASKGYL